MNATPTVPTQEKDQATARPKRASSAIPTLMKAIRAARAKQDTHTLNAAVEHRLLRQGSARLTPSVPIIMSQAVRIPAGSVMRTIARTV